MAVSPDRLKKVLNMLLSDNEGERRAAFDRLETMRSSLPPNTILADYLSGRGSNSSRSGGKSYKAEYELAVRELVREKEISHSYSRQLEAANEALQHARRQYVGIVDVLHEERDERNKLRVTKWTEDQVAWLRNAYVLLVEQCAGQQKWQRADAFKYLVKQFNDRFDTNRSGLSIRKKLADMRAVDASIGPLFPEHGALG